MSEDHFTEKRGGQIFVGGAILFVLTVLVVSLLIGWRMIPGWVGESFGMLAGVLSSPFFMEASFGMIGLLIVIGLNIWRRNREDDEFVSMEELDKRDAAKAGKS